MPENQPKNSTPENDTPNGKVLARATIEEHFSGPLPHPVILQKYEEILPGSAERIFEKFESQTEHRHKMERWLVATESVKSILGVFFGFIIGMTAVAGGIYSALQSHPFLGGSLSFAGLALLVGAFVTNRFFPKNTSEDTDKT